LAVSSCQTHIGLHYGSLALFPSGPEDRDSIHRLTYYQWVPIILLVQAVFFHLPHILWISLAERSGLDVNSVVMTGEMLSTVQMEVETGPPMPDNDKRPVVTIRDGLLRHMAVQINR